MSHHPSAPVDLNHTINRDSILLGLFLGAQLNRIASLEAEQLRLARLQWWNSLTPAQQRAERARIAQEQARLQWEHELKRYEAERREPLRRYRSSRVSWFVLLGFGALIAGAIAGRHHGGAWGAFAAYLLVAALLYLGPLHIRASERRRQREAAFERDHPHPPVMGTPGVSCPPVAQALPRGRSDQEAQRPARALLPAGAEKELSSALPAVSCARSAGAPTGSTVANRNETPPDPGRALEQVRDVHRFLESVELEAPSAELTARVDELLRQAERLPEGEVRDEATRLALAIAQKLPGAGADARAHTRGLSEPTDDLTLARGLLAVAADSERQRQALLALYREQDRRARRFGDAEFIHDELEDDEKGSSIT